MNTHSTVGTVTGLWAELPRNCDSISGKRRIRFPSLKRPYHISLYLTGSRGFFTLGIMSEM
jgi:hypothetical protein